MEQPERPAYDVRVEQDVSARMRDGTILRADVAWPVPRERGAQPERFPVLLRRTPYKKSAQRALAAAGYIAVDQDVRGRYASDGEYDPTGYLCGAPLDPQDGYDTAEWAAGLDGADGQVGAFGTSYPAWEAWALAFTRPPALKAMYVSGMSVTSTKVEGIPRPGRRLQWFHYTGAPDVRRRLGLRGAHTREEGQKAWDLERHKWLWFLPWSELPDHALGPMTPYLKAYFRDPATDHFSFAGRHGEIDLPVFHRTGWYDRFVSTIDHFVAMQAQARTAHARASQRLLVGPWGHTNALTRKVGEFDFGPEAELDDTELMLRWFDYWLKGRPTGVLDAPPVRYFLMGRNEWRGAEIWPPAGTVRRAWYLASGGRANTAYGDGRLSTAPPADAGGPAPADRYAYDPRDPVPTIWPAGDQNVPLDHRVIDAREDLLVYVTDPLEAPVEVAGDATVTLFAASSARDTDFVARLADDHPDGAAQPLCTGIVRARYRDGFDRPRLLEPGSAEAYTIQLSPVAHCFLPGHRLRLEITSSDFPNYDRNHNTGGDDFSDATLVTAHQTVLHSARYPSCVTLPLLAGEDRSGRAVR
jgi:putative CocE/NonD family hydrolase